jgi:hypothetical protein
MKKKPNHILISSLLMTVLCVAALALIAPLPGGGWWFGAQVQNASSGNAVVTYTIYDYATPNPQTRVDNIGSGASRLYLPTDFSLPGNFQGSSIASSNQDIRAIVNLTNRYTGSLGDIDSPSPAAGQYQGMGSVDTKLIFPLVKNDYVKKSTTIIVQNVGTGPAAATAAFKFQGDLNTYNYTTPVLNPGQMAIFGPIDARRGTYPNYYHPSIGAVGSLTLTSSQLLAGIALEHFTGEDHATVLQATRGLTDSDANSIVFAPINKNNYYDRFTGLQVQNADTHSVNITVGYYPTCQSGKIVDQYNGLLPGASQTFASDKLPNNCFASAVITATGNIVGVVNEYFTGYFMTTHPGHAQEATSYAALPRSPFIYRHILSVPLYKEDSYSKATGVSIQNIGSSTAWVVATFKNNNNQTFVTNGMNINSGKAIVLQDMRLLENNQNPPSWWHGWNGASMNPTVLGCAEGTYNGCGANGVFSLILNSTNNYPIVAVANESTYPNTAPLINQDKSNYEAFSLISVP